MNERNEKKTRMRPAVHDTFLYFSFKLDIYLKKNCKKYYTKLAQIHNSFNLIENPALPRVLIASPTVYPRLVLFDLKTESLLSFLIKIWGKSVNQRSQLFIYKSTYMCTITYLKIYLNIYIYMYISLQNWIKTDNLLLFIVNLKQFFGTKGCFPPPLGYSSFTPKRLTT